MIPLTERGPKPATTRWLGSERSGAGGTAPRPGRPADRRPWRRRARGAGRTALARRFQLKPFHSDKRGQLAIPSIWRSAASSRRG